MKHITNLSRSPASDECYTPVNKVYPILKYLDKSKTYYEATSKHSSAILDGFTAEGFNIEGSGDKDFFDCNTNDVYDGVITNPPYSLKDKFIEHCYSLEKPFALLLPLQALQGQRRGKMFLEYGISAIVYNKRIDFTGGGSPSFGNVWLHWGLTDSGKLEFV